MCIIYEHFNLHLEGYLKGALLDILATHSFHFPVSGGHRNLSVRLLEKKMARVTASFSNKEVTFRQ